MDSAGDWSLRERGGVRLGGVAALRQPRMEPPAIDQKRAGDGRPQSLVQFGSVALSVQELLAGLAHQVRADLYARSNARPAADEVLEAVVGVPALANSNQRYLTVEAFTRAGFHVCALVTNRRRRRWSSATARRACRSRSRCWCTISAAARSTCPWCGARRTRLKCWQ